MKKSLFLFIYVFLLVFGIKAQYTGTTGGGFTSGQTISNQGLGALAVALQPLIFNTICPNSQAYIGVAATGFTNSSNQFDIQLSNSTGSFSSPTTIGTLYGNSPGNVLVTFPSTLPNGNNYRIRIKSTNPVVTSAASGSLSVSSYVSAQAGSDVRLCNQYSAILAGNSATCGIGTWTVLAGSGQFGNVNSSTSTVTALSAGTNTFEWTINDGNQSTSDTMSIYVSPLISGLTLGTVTTNSAIVNWNVPANVDSGYMVRYMENCTGTYFYLFVSNPSARQATITGLNPCTQYCYSVRPNCSGVSAQPIYYPTPITFNTQQQFTSCAAVNQITSTANGCNQTVSWNTCIQADSFRLRYRLGSNAWMFSPFTTASSITLSNLVSNSTYFYRVQTYCNNVLVATATQQSFISPSCSSIRQGFLEENCPVVVSQNNSGGISISKSEEVILSEIKIYDLSGREVWNISEVPEEDIIKINVPELGQGWYLLELTTAEGQRIVKKITGNF